MKRLPARYVQVALERHPGRESVGKLICGNLLTKAPKLAEHYAGQVQTIYLDPPFNTGKRFEMKARVGEKGYRTGSPSLSLLAFDDRFESREAYLTFMREAISVARELLCREGTLFLHIDARMSALLRILMDEIFGESNFLNEIVWAYQTGGRARSYFPRKHDTILFYAKSRSYYFNLKAVPIARTQARSNHMRRGVDEAGRTYRAINSGGREYRYYDDEPTYPGDVWDDVSHLQQKDPQRTGYDTQKPLRLLERIIRCSTQEGDLVGDLFLGSGTTAVAAMQLGRRFLCLDQNPLAIAAASKRLLLARGEKKTQSTRKSGNGQAPGFEIEAPCAADDCDVEAEIFPAISSYTVRLLRFDSPQAREAGIDGLDSVDLWSTGFLQGNVYQSCAQSARTSASPALLKEMEMPVQAGEPCVLIVDIWGNRRFYLPQRRY